jgi:hypothetical protein
MAMAVPFLASLGAGATGTAGVVGSGSTLAAVAASSVAPTVTAAAGMSTASQVMLGLTALSGGASAVASHQAGVAADQSARQAAKQEKDAARGREIERRRGLLTALASQGAAAGAGGIGFSGGVAAAAKRDIKDARNDLLTDTVNTRRNVRMLRLQGKSARQSGDLGAATSLIDSGVRGYSNFG